MFTPHFKNVLAIGFAAMLTSLVLYPVDRASAQGSSYDWSGFYAGVQVGYADGTDDFLFPGFITMPDPDGVFGGVHFGYNMQTANNWVFGIVGDVNVAGIDGVGVLGATTNTVDVDFTASVRGKVGYAWDRYLIYGTAGLAIAEIDYTNQFGASPTLSYNQTAAGITVGGGVDVAVNDWLSALVEYRYTSYESASQPAVTVGAFNFAAFSRQLETHQVQVGFSVKLDKLFNTGN